MRVFENRLIPAFALLLAATYLISPVLGEELVPPEQVGMSAERLHRLTLEAQHYVESGNLVGIVSLVARRGKIVYLEAVGHQDRERNLPMKTDTIFRIASMTKPITSLAILMLYEEGRLQLTDPLSKYVPEFTRTKVWITDGTLEDAEREITIYDLLTHNSGLSYHYNENVGGRYVEAGIANGLAPDRDPIGADVRALAKIPLAQQPGAGFHYGLSTDVLGHVVEVVSGTSLAEFFEQRFFRQLNMHDTAFFLSEADSERLVQLYVRDETGALVPENRPRTLIAGLPVGGRTPFDGPQVSFSGGGGLTSTCEDYFSLLSNGAPERPFWRQQVAQQEDGRAGFASTSTGGRRMVLFRIERFRLGIRCSIRYRDVATRLTRNASMGRSLQHHLLHRSQGTTDRHQYGSALPRRDRVGAEISAACVRCD